MNTNRSTDILVLGATVVILGTSRGRHPLPDTRLESTS